MALTATAMRDDLASLPDDPVLVLAMVIDKIQRQELRVRNHAIFKRPTEPDAMELVVGLEALKLYNDNIMARPVANIDSDIGDVYSGELTYKTLSVRDILDEIREFRRWRDTVRRDRMYAGVTGNVPMMAAEEARQMLRAGAAGLSKEQIEAIREAMDRENTYTQPKAAPAAPAFEPDWSPTDILDDSPDDDDGGMMFGGGRRQGKRAKTEARLREEAARKAAKAARDAERDKPSSAPPKRELIFE